MKIKLNFDKMNKIIIIACLLLSGSKLFSQTVIDKVLAEIEKNNTTLTALRKNADADKIGNKTGIFLQNPEVEFNYLWGNPSAIGNRTDVRITQTFDFPTTYKYKNQISDYKNEQVELEYQKQKKEILLKARIICNSLIYSNAVLAELSKRKLHADSIASAYKLKFEAGETNIIDFNKARLNLLTAEKEMEQANIDRSSLLTELMAFNGGNFVDFTESIFQPAIIPADFDEWYVTAEQNNPVLGWLKQEIEISQNREKLNRAMNLPKLQTGYMSEKTDAEHFQGITLGVSIPLWENKNTVKYAESQTVTLQSIEADNKLQFYNQLKNLHSRAVSLQKSVGEYENGLQSLNNTVLLRKALDGGEISLIDYILELTVYYESIDKLLEMKKELYNSLAELNQYM